MNRVIIGNNRYDIEVTEEYRRLADEDQMVGDLLLYNSQFRHSIYFYIQAMEKSIKSMIFTKINPNLEFNRKYNSTHSLTELIDTLVMLFGSSEVLRDQIRIQLNSYVLKGINYQHLHNNLRYPNFSERYNSYSVTDFSAADCNEIKNRLSQLKIYLSGLHRL